MMEIEEHGQSEPQMTPDIDRCPRHGSRVSRDHRCPRCVIEEVRRAERRHGVLSQQDEPVVADSVHQAI